MQLNAARHFPEAPLQTDPRLGADYGICSESGTVYYLQAQTRSYDGDYFLSEYSEQYGRSYIQDEPHLSALAERRLELLPAPGSGSAPDSGKPRLLEIGCATGFFLRAARERGYQCEGLEVSEYAAAYGRDTLGLDIQTASFLDVELPDAGYDVIAAVYVGEHFAEQRQIFAKIARALRPGGQFLFALPSTNGPLFEYRPEEWVRTHPPDHHADYSPASLRVVFAEHGLAAGAMRPSSFHPQRARGWKGLLPAFAYQQFARLAVYGDTFEGVAVKGTWPSRESYPIKILTVFALVRCFSNRNIPIWYSCPVSCVSAAHPIASAVCAL